MDRSVSVAIVAAPMRVAAVDLGTHATRLLVADVEDGRIQEVERDLVFTKFGEDVDRRR